MDKSGCSEYKSCNTVSLKQRKMEIGLLLLTAYLYIQEVSIAAKIYDLE